MGITNKGSRKIVVDGTEYRWRASSYRKTSEWRSGEGIMDEEFMRYARYYGLGSVSDIVFNVPVELYKNPGSKIVITFYALRVDGFHGPEQLMMIKPGLIARLIKICIGAGWNPKEKGDFKVKLFASPVVGETSVLILSPKPNTGPNPEELVFELTEL